MSAPIVIDARELVQVLCRTKGSTFATIEYQTEVELKDRSQKGKRRLPKVEALKINTVQVQTTFDYVKGVERRLDAEGKDHSEFKRGTSWHHAVVDQDGKFTPFAQHPETGEVYFRCQHINTIGEPQYLIDATTLVSPDAVAKFLPERRNYENQGLDSPLKFLVFKLRNLRAISVGGEKYVIKHDDVESEHEFPATNRAVWDSLVGAN